MDDGTPTGARHPLQGEGIQLLRLDKEAVLCGLDGHQWCALNETAAALWELCDGETSIEEMAEAVSVLSGQSRAELLTGIQGALRELSSVGVIRWR